VWSFMERPIDGSRRRFLKSAGVAVPALLHGPAVLSQKVEPTHNAVASRNYLGKRARLNIAMWDFSWLHANQPGGAYEHLEQRVAEAAERGYNTLRVDCFPSRVLESDSTFPKNWTAGKDLPAWGMTPKTFTCNVRERVRTLADLCRKHQIWLGLDSWDKDHMFRAADPTHWRDQMIAAADEESAFTRYGELWVRALKMMREDGVLERAVWVAPMNEVPHFGSRSIASVKALSAAPKNEGETRLDATSALDAIYRRLNGSMGEPIKAAIAKDQIPLSYSSLGAENYAARVTEIYDIVDVHFMPQVLMNAEDKGAFLKAGVGAPDGNFQRLEKYQLAQYSTAWDAACCRHYPAMLQRARQYFEDALDHTLLPSGKRLQAILTECYGPCYWPDHPDVSWAWYKRYNSDALRVVAATSFTGASLSNYGEPIFDLWQDVDWHLTGNEYFQAAAGNIIPVPFSE
jgi:hypothetical protein